MAEYIDELQLPQREQDSHKGTFGTAMLFCGSYGMAGAAILAARAALRTGVGIARIVLPRSIYKPVTTAVPEAVCSVMGRFNFIKKRQLRKQISGADAILFGPGVGTSGKTERLLKWVIKISQSPLVIDADGINILARNINIIRRANCPVVMTPHPGEMSRLTGLSITQIQSDREGVASEFAKRHGVYLVLKGSGSIVATPNGQTFINKSGNPGMATGGSGDVLSGITVSFLAQRQDITCAVKNAVFIHGMSGDDAARRLGRTYMLPSDMLEELPRLFKMFEG